jgi:hypothetical protein
MYDYDSYGKADSTVIKSLLVAEKPCENFLFYVPLIRLLGACCHERDRK